MSKESILEIHGQRFYGDSATCFKILDLMQDVTPIDCVYDFDAEFSNDRIVFYRTMLECKQTAGKVFAHGSRTKAQEAVDLAIANRENKEEAA